MGKVLVLFHSNTGSTARMADLIAEGAGLIPGTDVRIRNVAAATPDDVYWCDGIAFGSPTNMGVLSWQAKRFWDEAMGPHWGKLDGKVGCAFSSSGAHEAQDDENARERRHHQKDCGRHRENGEIGRASCRERV